MIYYSPRRFSLLYQYVMQHGIGRDSERGMTREILNGSFVVRNPRDRLITEPWRKTNFPFAIAEWLSLITGDQKLSTMTQFIKSYGEYSSDGINVDGAYGPRTKDQIPAIIETLKTTPNSRRAVMTVYQSEDLLYRAGGKNTPCTTSLQFLIRNRQLVLLANMRSNDLFYGLTHDLIVFTMLQEYIARKLGVEPGPYYHMAGSLHIYERHFEEEVVKGRHWNLVMNKMPLIDDVAFTTFADAYENVEGYEGDPQFGPYYNDLFNAARCFIFRKKDEDMSRKAYWEIKDYTIRRVLRPWLEWRLAEME